jgi:ABC-2 type transport system permease protein
MLKHILKDVRLHRRFILTFGLLCPLYMGYFGSRLSTPTIAAIFGSFLYAIVPFMISGREDRFKAVSLALSLPTTRREIMRSRYLLGWLLMAAVYLLSSVLMALMPGGKLGFSDVFAVRTILIALAFMTLVFSILLPLFIWLGMAGLMAFLVAIQVLGVVFMLLRFAVGQSAIALIRVLPRAITAALDAFGPAGAATAVVALLVLINAASLAISIRIFARKEF